MTRGSSPLPAALAFAALLLLLATLPATAWAQTSPIKPRASQGQTGSKSHEGHVQGKYIWDPGKLPPRATEPTVKVGDQAPDFTLPSISGQKVSLGDFRGRKNVVLSFVPAAWTPACSEQWPGYNLGREEIEKRDGIILGISVDNIPTLHAWAESMGGCWFPILSDFYPHGEVAERYGVLRPEGFTERALFIIDKQGVVQYVEIADINKTPRLESVIRALERINKGQ